MLEWIDLIKCALIVIGALVYFVLPLDLVPDWFPVAGRLDDVLILLTAIPSMVKLRAMLHDDFRSGPRA